MAGSDPSADAAQGPDDHRDHAPSRLRASPPPTSAFPPADALKKQLGLSYHVDSLLRLAQKVDLAGAAALEIGGTLPAGFVNDVLGVKTWTAVDFRATYAAAAGAAPAEGALPPLKDLRPEHLDAPWSGFDGQGQDIPAWADGRFDLIVSLATLEHVAELPRLLRRAHALLRTGGLAWFLVGPIWSGHRGHHVYPGHFAPYVDKTAAFLAKIEPWHHLLISSMEFHRWLFRNWGAEFADLAHYRIFESARLNRLFFQDYEIAFEQSGLDKVLFRPWESPCPSQVHLGRVQRRYPEAYGFDIDGFEILLTRP
jgi:SAM-dependent methyltransferase